MIPTIVQDVLFLKMKINESKRIIHELTSDGDICSIDKDPCMVITRTANGFVYKCHRCSESGTVSMNYLSPTDTVKALAAVREKEAPGDTVMEVSTIELPKDCTAMITTDGKWNSTDVPWHAIHWLWQAGWLTPTDIDFEVYWSHSHNRVIFPIRTVDEDLIGWVGRGVSPDQAKYKTRKIKGSNRLLYIVKGHNDHAVFVEDILSAIKVNKATGYTTVALLTTHITMTMVTPYRHKQCYLWLDGDMLSKSVSKVARLNQFGCKIRSIRTKLDPKEYTPDEIKSNLGIPLL